MTAQIQDKGMYPQSDGSLAIVDIDASKGFVDLWEHFALRFLLFLCKKNNWNGFRPRSNMFNISFLMGKFSY